ncbi:MAG: hypothetical protein NT080_01695 [Spirochaetes bacterium]|nr:hypothetical protein [Spirochaetota bacterium]
MRRTRMVFLTITAAILATAAVPALDIGLEGSLSNLAFPYFLTHSMSVVESSNSEPYINNPFAWMAPVPDTTGTFPTEVYGTGALAYVDLELVQSIRTRISLGFDPTLRSFISATIGYSSGPVEIGFGPYIGGLYNTKRTLTKNGITAFFRFEQPGLVFISGNIVSSLMGLIGRNDYVQESVKLESGIYVRGAICSLSLESKEFVRQGDDSGSVTYIDALNRYMFNIDAFKKGAPYNLLVRMGYQDVSKTYGDAKDRIGGIIIGTRLTLRPRESVSVFADLETSVFTFGQDELTGKGPDSDSFMFNTAFGLRFSIGAVPVTRADHAAPDAVEPGEPGEAAPGN